MVDFTCNKKRANHPAISYLLAFALAIYGVPVFAQGLPWQSSQPSAQQGQPQYPAQNPPQHHHHSGSYNGSPAHTAVDAKSARAQDDRKLDMLATKFYGITAKSPHVITRLKALQHEVKSFRSGLGYRGYDASDIISDARKLEGRIASQRKKLEAEAAAEAKAVPSEATTPMEAPPTPPCCKTTAVPNAAAPVSAPPAPQAATPPTAPVAPLPTALPAVPAAPPAPPRSEIE